MFYLLNSRMKKYIYQLWLKKKNQQQNNKKTCKNSVLVLGGVVWVFFVCFLQNLSLLKTAPIFPGLIQIPPLPFSSLSESLTRSDLSLLTLSMNFFSLTKSLMYHTHNMVLNTIEALLRAATPHTRFSSLMAIMSTNQMSSGVSQRDLRLNKSAGLLVMSLHILFFSFFFFVIYFFIFI